MSGPRVGKKTATLYAGAVFYLASALAGWALGGPTGLWTTCVVLVVLALVALRTEWVRTPRAARFTPRAGVERGDVRHSPGYRRSSEAVSWSDAGRRHYDHVTRPVLLRLTRSRLLDRYGLDLEREPERAAELVGAELWPLVDPGRPVGHDTKAPGVPLARVERLIARLEEM